MLFCQLTSNAMNCRAASKQRIILDRAAKSKASLEAGIKALAKSGRREDAEALTTCILGMQPDAGLLQEELEAAQQALAKFEALAASQARLDKAVKEAGSSAAVERALQVWPACKFIIFDESHMFVYTQEQSKDGLSKGKLTSTMLLSQD